MPCLFFLTVVSLLSPTPRPEDWGSLRVGLSICNFRKPLRGCWCLERADSLGLTHAVWKASARWPLSADLFPSAASCSWQMPFASL